MTSYWAALLPLAVALPRMLEKIEADLATAGPTETERLPTRRVDPRAADAAAVITYPMLT